jgi:hypothetical protein
MLHHHTWSCMIKKSSNSYPCVNHSWSTHEHAWTMCAHIKSIGISFSQTVALVSLSSLSTALKRSLSFSPPVFATITFLAGSYTSLCVIPAASVSPSSLSTTQLVALVSITFHTGSYTTWARTAPLLASKMWSKVIDKCGKSMLHMIRNSISNLMYGSILVIFIFCPMENHAWTMHWWCVNHSLDQKCVISRSRMVHAWKILFYFRAEWTRTNGKLMKKMVLRDHAWTMHDHAWITHDHAVNAW